MSSLTTVYRRVRHAAWAVDKRVRHGRLRVRTTAHRGYRAAIAAAEVVTIDVFDTALFRCVPKPVDVFEILGIRLRNAGATLLDPQAFRDLRIAAEREARRRATAAGCEEVTLDEIYVELLRIAPEIDGPRAIAEELAVERAVCVANADIRTLVASLRSAGRRIVFVSDTYFPRSFVISLLENAGYGTEPEVVVSNEHRATKEHGTLLPLVARRLGVAPQAIVHVGDNLGADVIATLGTGANAFWYTGRVGGRTTKDATIADKVIDRLEALAMLDELPTTEERVLHTMGYGTVGPIFLGMVQWLVERIRSHPADIVLFCARDGYLLNEVYARFERYETLPPARYFEVSRRALVFPVLTKIDKRALDVLCANNAPLPLPEFFSRIGIDVTAYPEELAAAGLTLGTRVYDTDSRQRLRRLFVLLEDVVLERARSEHSLLHSYLRQSGVFEASAIVLVDIGWGGTLQQALADVLVAESRSPNISAYYLSTDQRIRNVVGAGSAEAWFANAGQPEWMQEALGPGYFLLEVAFAAPHGTILGYRRNEDGTTSAVHHTYDADSPNARACRGMHRSSLELIDRWLQIFDGTGPSLPMRSTFARFERFVHRPTNDETRFFGDLVHIGGLGTTTEVIPIASPPPLRDVLKRPRSLRQAYVETTWPLAFVQRILRNNAAARGLIGVRTVFRRTRRDVKRFLKLEQADATA